MSAWHPGRWGWPRDLEIDIALGAVIAVAQGTGTWIVGARDHPLDLLGLALLAGTAASLVVRRVWPVGTLVTAAAFAVAYNALGYPGAFWTISLGLALYTAVAAGRRIPAIAAITGAFAGLVGVGTLFRLGHFTDLSGGALWFAGWMTAGFVAGEVSRARRAYLEEVERSSFEAERTREEEVRRRATEERMRIARELHDVLAHTISLINVQSGVALHLLERQPERARPALETISQASKDALRDLRATLDVLRGADGDDPRAPAPSLARLDDLVRGARAAGVDVRLHVTGATRPLPPGVDLAAYRIAQESLTNVARHAGTGAATLAIDYGAAALTVEVADEGRSSTPHPLRNGHGLIGMRERAASVGGELEAGPRPEGGFHVLARLPLDVAP